MERVGRTGDQVRCPRLQDPCFYESLCLSGSLALPLKNDLRDLWSHVMELGAVGLSYILSVRVIP